MPVAAYQVSGEYAMITAAAANGWVDRRAAALESLVSIRRAEFADIVLSYWAAEAAGGSRDPRRDSGQGTPERAGPMSSRVSGLWVVALPLMLTGYVCDALATAATSRPRLSVPPSCSRWCSPLCGNSS